MTKTQITWLVSTVGGSLAVLAAVFSLWPVVGWTTPNQHDNDFVVAIEELKEFRDEWKCDEYDEELLEMQQKLATASEAEKVEIQHIIDKLKAKMEKINCSRFEDFG